MTYFNQHPLVARYVVASAAEGFRPPNWTPNMHMEAMRAETVRLGLSDMPEQHAGEILSIARYCVAGQSSTDVDYTN